MEANRRLENKWNPLFYQEYLKMGYYIEEVSQRKTRPF
jgi:hypothetical protein